MEGQFEDLMKGVTTRVQALECQHKWSGVICKYVWPFIGWLFGVVKVTIGYCEI